MNHKDPRVTVVIPTRNRAESLKRMLNSLLSQSYSDFEVIVVDGESTDNTPEVVASYKNKLDIKHVVSGEWLVKDMNKGVKLARGEIFIRTDDDAEYNPDTIKELVAMFDLGDHVGGASGPTVTPNKQSRDLFLFQEKLKRGNVFWRLVGKFYYDVILEGMVDEIGVMTRSGAPTLGSNTEKATQLGFPIEVGIHEAITLAIRTDLLREMGGFNELYGEVGECNEVEASLRLREMRKKIMFNPKAWSYHHTSKAGIYSARAGAYSRILNFINFYFLMIKPNTFQKMFRFLSYLLFQNAYYIYMFVVQRKIVFLGCIPGTIQGLFINVFKKESWVGGYDYDDN